MYIMYKRFLVLVVIMLFGVGHCSNVYDISVGFCETVDGEVYTVPIDMLFYGECLTCTGCSILSDIRKKIGQEKVLIECSTNRKYQYLMSWELAEVYAYKIAKELICLGVEPIKIMYLGYTSKVKSGYEPNVVVFKIRSKWF